jgi:hypothetical protein
MNSDLSAQSATDKSISVIELRHYVLRPGQRDNFIDYFEDHFVQSQNEMGTHILGQFRPKGMENNFFWIRGFSDMVSRSKFLPAFYYGPIWKQFGAGANSLLANNDNVYLLKPLTKTGEINSNEFGKEKGIVVIDFYIANSKLEKLIGLFNEKYNSALTKAGVNTMFWTSELTENDFPRLPVFQDKNLLVGITFYKDEAEYRQKLKLISSSVDADLSDELNDTITTQNTIILYPTEKSFYYGSH